MHQKKRKQDYGNKSLFLAPAYFALIALIYRADDVVKREGKSGDELDLCLCLIYNERLVAQPFLLAQRKPGMMNFGSISHCCKVLHNDVKHKQVL
jgi:hypothetical protein